MWCLLLLAMYSAYGSHHRPAQHPSNPSRHCETQTQPLCVPLSLWTWSDSSQWWGDSARTNSKLNFWWSRDLWCCLDVGQHVWWSGTVPVMGRDTASSSVPSTRAGTRARSPRAISSQWQIRASLGAFALGTGTPFPNQAMPWVTAHNSWRFVSAQAPVSEILPHCWNAT